MLTRWFRKLDGIFEAGVGKRRALFLIDELDCAQSSYLLLFFGRAVGDLVLNR
jgi:hypothetical protein